MQRRQSRIAAWTIDDGAASDQRDRDGGAIALGGDVQRRAAAAVHQALTGATLEQQLDGIDAALL